MKFPVGVDVVTFTREGAEMYEVWDMVAAERQDTQVTKMLQNTESVVEQRDAVKRRACWHGD